MDRVHKASTHHWLWVQPAQPREAQGAVGVCQAGGAAEAVAHTWGPTSRQTRQMNAAGFPPELLALLHTVHKRRQQRLVLRWEDVYSLLHNFTGGELQVVPPPHSSRILDLKPALEEV